MDNGLVRVPCVGGFICGPDSSPEWIATVLDAWKAYYGSVGQGRRSFDGMGRRRIECDKESFGVLSGVDFQDKCGCSRQHGVGGISDFRSGVREDRDALLLGDVHGCKGERVEDVLGVSGGHTGDVDGRVVEEVEEFGGLTGESVERQESRVPVWRVKSLPRGPNFERNQRNREAKRRSKRGENFKREVGVPSELRESWIERKNAENKLAVLKAEKDMAYQRSRDSEAEAKARRIALVKKTEKDKVAVEKAFSTLKATGNVPGFCETVVSGEPSLTEGETISPSSSISNAEVRAMQKKLLDLERENKLLKLANREEVAFTVDENGSLPAYVKEDLVKAEFEDFEHDYDNDGDEYEGIKPKHIYITRRCHISTDRDFEGFGDC